MSKWHHSCFPTINSCCSFCCLLYSLCGLCGDGVEWNCRRFFLSPFDCLFLSTIFLPLMSPVAPPLCCDLISLFSHCHDLSYNVCLIVRCILWFRKENVDDRGGSRFTVFRTLPPSQVSRSAPRSPRENKFVSLTTPGDRGGSRFPVSSHRQKTQTAKGESVASYVLATYPAITLQGLDGVVEFRIDFQGFLVNSRLFDW